MHEVVEKRTRERDGTRHANAHTGRQGHEVRRGVDPEGLLTVRMNEAAYGPSYAGGTSFVDYKVPGAATSVIGSRLDSIATARGCVAWGEGYRNVPFMMQPKCIETWHLKGWRACLERWGIRNKARDEEVIELAGGVHPAARRVRAAVGEEHVAAPIAAHGMCESVGGCKRPRISDDDFRCTTTRNARRRQKNFKLSDNAAVYSFAQAGGVADAVAIFAVLRQHDVCHEVAMVPVAGSTIDGD